MDRTPAGVAEMLSSYTRGRSHLNFLIISEEGRISPETAEFYTIETLMTVAVLTTVSE